MPSKDNTDFESAAILTVGLVDHASTPDELSEVILEALVDMVYDIEINEQTRINIWHRETGLSVQSLAALYRMYETGAGYRRSRIYANYEIGVRERRKKMEEDNNGNS